MKKTERLCGKSTESPSRPISGSAAIALSIYCGGFKTESSTDSLKVAVIDRHQQSRAEPGEEIAEGIKLVVEEIRSRSPKTRVLLLAIFPREEDRVRLTKVLPGKQHHQQTR
jgi:hypothetical protein